MKEVLQKIKFSDEIGILLGGILILLRVPKIIMEGRFWAEMGSNYFADAMNYSWYEPFLKNQDGFYGIYPRIAALIAAALPLRYAPYADIGLALLAQLSLVYLIFKSGLLTESWHKGLALLLILFATPSNEVWLTCTTIHFHFGAGAGIILCSPSSHKIPKWGLRIYLLIIGLTGPVACFLLPLFWLRYFLDKDKARLDQCLWLTGAGCVQFLAVLVSLQNQTRQVSRDFSHVLPSFAVRHIGLPWLGYYSRYMSTQLVSEVFWKQGFWYGIIALALVGYRWIFAEARKTPAILWLLASMVVISLLSSAGQLSGIGSIEMVLMSVENRYGFAPNVLLLLAFLLASKNAVQVWRRRISMIMVGWAIVVGFGYYITDSAYFFHGPSWPGAVKAHELHPEQPIPVWPEPWVIKLNSTK